MKKTTGRALIMILVAALMALVTLPSCMPGEARRESGRPPAMGDISFIDDMSADEITQYLRGKVFIDYPHASAGWGEIMYFAPQGDEYYWFCSSGDGQSRLRAAKGTWSLTDDGMTLATQKLIEWEGGHYTGIEASYGTRFVLHDYDAVVSEVQIETETHIQLFQYVLWTDDETGDVTASEMGFSGAGGVGVSYYCNPGYVDADSLKEFYEPYFTLFES